MARSYKRDKNGRFASGGGSGSVSSVSGSGGRIGRSATYRSPGSATGSSGTYRNAGTGRRRTGTLTAKSPARDHKENRFMNRKSDRTANKVLAANAKRYNTQMARRKKK